MSWDLFLYELWDALLFPVELCKKILLFANDVLRDAVWELAELQYNEGTWYYPALNAPIRFVFEVLFGLRLLAVKAHCLLEPQLQAEILREHAALDLEYLTGDMPYEQYLQEVDLINTRLERYIAELEQDLEEMTRLTNE